MPFQQQRQEEAGDHRAGGQELLVPQDRRVVLEADEDVAEERPDLVEREPDALGHRDELEDQEDQRGGEQEQPRDPDAPSWGGSREAAPAAPPHGVGFDGTAATSRRAHVSGVAG
ncbi:hypothetical protein [Lentzea jiangxiensis]|uniref:hypothetical protein n=1 Tax=Lentzea jiangxiensis TaxID=641025 RepID=UPI001C40A4BB|nr:hypothetical protein [Lentzea jiangxiensis]